MTDTELKIKAFGILRTHLGMVEMEKFISIIQHENFDYTRWRSGLFEAMSGEEISREAMKGREKSP